MTNNLQDKPIIDKPSKILENIPDTDQKPDAGPYEKNTNGEQSGFFIAEWVYSLMIGKTGKHVFFNVLKKYNKYFDLSTRHKWIYTIFLILHIFLDTLVTIILYVLIILVLVLIIFSFARGIGLIDFIYRDIMQR